MSDLSKTNGADDAGAATRTRQLFERLANTSHRRSLTADRIFRQLRKEDEAKERARQAQSAQR